MTRSAAENRSRAGAEGRHYICRNKSYSLLEGARRDFLFKIGDELLDGARAKVALRAVAHADRAGFRFSSAYDEHVGDFFDLGVADFGLQLFVTVVEMDADACILQLLRDFLRVLLEFSAEGQDRGL